QYGRIFGWRSTLYGDVITKLAEARARTIVFDVLFDIPTDDDDQLADAIDEALGRATFVVQPSFGELRTRSARIPASWTGFGEVAEPVPVLKDVGSGVGMATQDPDSDGTVRRVPLVFDVNGEPYPALPLMAVAKFLRRPSAFDGPVVNDRIPLAGREIPIDAR